VPAGRGGVILMVRSALAAVLAPAGFAWAACGLLASGLIGCGRGGAVEASGTGAATSAGQAASGRTDVPRPDVLFVAVDGLRLEDMTAFGGSLAQTLGYDTLAEEGTVYVEAFAPSPWPDEALAAALSGQYAASVAKRMGAEWTPSLAETLSHDGYRCGLLLGHSQHRPALMEPPPELLAAAPVEAAHSGGSVPGQSVGADDPVPGFDVTLLVEGAGSVAGARADRVAEEAVRWLLSEEGPTFLVATLGDPRPPHHLYAGLVEAADVPYEGPMTAGLSHAELLRRRYEFTAEDRQRLRELHASEIAMTDKAFRRIAGTFMTRRQTPPVLVVIGLRPAALGEDHRYGLVPSFEPEALRVPMMIRFPQPAVDGSAMDASAADALSGDVEIVTSLLDLAPTVLDSLGFEPRYDIEGRSVFPGARVDARDVFATTLRGRQGGALIQWGQATSAQLGPDSLTHFRRSKDGLVFKRTETPTGAQVDFSEALRQRLAEIGLSSDAKD
ncbi:MAG: sulfatase-like hydrolase/transferase, partial [Planctomycetota bacterium]